MNVNIVQHAFLLPPIHEHFIGLRSYEHLSTTVNLSALLNTQTNVIFDSCRLIREELKEFNYETKATI